MALKIKSYDRENAVFYAESWAYKRNPRYGAFDKMGGDCTNFISQCIFAGSGIMNYTPVTGWYYLDYYRRSPAWTGVEFLYNFLTNNKGTGPRAKPCRKEDLLLGDIVQLYNHGEYTHTLIVTDIDKSGGIYVAAHDFDAFNRGLDTYIYEGIRYADITGIYYY